MMKTKTYVALVLTSWILVIIGGVLIDYYNTVMHESAHRQFAIYNGCTDWDTKVNIFTDSYFICTERKEVLTDEMKNTEYILDSMNEIVTYNVSTIWLTILIVGLLMLFMIVTIEYVRDGGNKDG